MSIEEKPTTRSTNLTACMDGIKSNRLMSPSVIPLPPPAPSTTSMSRSRGNENSAGRKEEEKRRDFLQQFSTIVTGNNTRLWVEGSVVHCEETDSGCENSYDEENLKHNTGNIGIQQIDSHTENNTDQQDNQAIAKFETILTGEDNETVTVITPSLLSDEEILQSLRTNLYGIDQRSIANTANGSVGVPGDQPVSEQLREDQEHHDTTVELFFEYFESAQAERLKKPHARPYLILGLFSNLSDIRSDLEWAQDAAYREQAGKSYVPCADYFAKERPMPWFTWFTLFVCTMAMSWAFFESDWKFVPLKTNPLFGPDPEVLLQVGALKGRILIEDSKWWLLITPIFLHAGIAHLLINGGMLLLLCQPIERNHGWLHTALIFLLSGMFGNMISALLQPSFILVGASGGIYGLFGACVGDIVLNSRFFFLVLEERARKETLERERRKLRKKRKEGRHTGRRNIMETTASNQTSLRDLIVGTCDPVAVEYQRRRICFWCYVSLVLDLFFNSLVGLLPFVDNFAHLGGLLFGFFVSLSSLPMISTSSFDYNKKEQRTTVGRWCRWLRIFALRFGGGLSALFLVFVGVVCLRRSDGTSSPCPNCRYVSCIALPKPWKPNDPKNWWTCDGCGSVRGQVYWGKDGDQQEILVTAEIFCPLGDTIQLDITNEGYTELQQAIDALPDLCREFCNYS